MARHSKPESYADTWIKHLGIEHHLPDEPSIGSRLVVETLRVFKTAAKYWVSPKARRAPVRTRKSLQQSYGLLVLWADGHGVADGALDRVMSSSISVRRSVIELLLSICRTLLTSQYCIARHRLSIITTHPILTQSRTTHHSLPRGSRFGPSAELVTRGSVESDS